MKLNSISIAVNFFLSLMVLASCESHEKKTNDAFDNFKEEKMMSEDSIMTGKEAAQEVNKVEPVKINENPDEWVKFKNEAEKRITTNENKIKKLKHMSDSDVKLFKKISHLEKNNDDLRRQLKEYEEEMKVNLEKFKERVMVDASEIDLKLKDISKNEKK
jgi:hypothetical protein